MSCYKRYCLVTLISFCSLYALAQTPIQEYYSVINHETGIGINDISNIEWGCIDKDRVRLDRIDANDGGKLEFNISEAYGVLVGLTSLTSANAVDFAFKFNNGSFKVIVYSQEKYTGGTYGIGDTFTILKCGINLEFFKNGNLLFSHCYSDTAEDLIHLTKVDMSIGTPISSNLNVIFNSDDDDCIISPLFEPISNDALLFEAKNQSERKSNESDVESAKRSNSAIKAEPYQIVSVNIHDGSRPIKSYRIRTDANGEIPAKHEVYTYLNKGYQIKIRKN